MTMPKGYEDHFSEGEWRHVERVMSRIETEDQREVEDLLGIMTETFAKTTHDRRMGVAALLRYGRALRSPAHGPVPDPERAAAAKAVLEHIIGRPAWRKSTQEDEAAEIDQLMEDQHE